MEGGILRMSLKSKDHCSHVYNSPTLSCWKTSQGSLLAEWEGLLETWPTSGMTSSGRQVAEWIGLRIMESELRR